jgi:hypothetical protein
VLHHAGVWNQVAADTGQEAVEDCYHRNVSNASGGVRLDEMIDVDLLHHTRTDSPVDDSDDQPLMLQVRRGKVDLDHHYYTSHESISMQLNL